MRNGWNSCSTWPAGPGARAARALMENEAARRAAVLTVGPIARASGRVRLPGSKSISNRALLLAALCEDRTELTGLLEADDTRVMIDALRALGVGVELQADCATVAGCGGGLPPPQADPFLGDAGTPLGPPTPAPPSAGGRLPPDRAAPHTG